MTNAKKKRLPKYLVDVRMVMLGIASFAGFLYVTTYAHEYGHLWICQMSGHEGIISRNGLGEVREESCFGTPDNIILYRAMGGIMGMVAGGIPLGIASIFRNSKVGKIIIMGSAPHVLANGIIMPMETFTNDFYMGTSELPQLLSNVPMFALLMFFFVKYAFTRNPVPQMQQ